MTRLRLGTAQAKALLACALEPQRVCELCAAVDISDHANLIAVLRNLKAKQLVEHCGKGLWALALGYHVDAALDVAFEMLHGTANAAD